MRILSGFRYFAVLCLLSALPQAQPAGQGPADLVRFSQWLTGEFDNFRQVSEELENKVAVPHGRVHVTVTPVTAPALGDRVFLARESPRDDPDRVGAAHLYGVTAAGDTITLRVFVFEDAEGVVALLNAPSTSTAVLPLDRVRALPGCEMTWKAEGAAFVGARPPGACRPPDRPATEGPATLADTHRLTADAWSFTAPAGGRGGAGAVPRADSGAFELRRARPFTCWAALRREGTTDKYDGMLDVVVHDQGKRITIRTEQGTPTPYSFELSQLRYAQQRPVMKLAVYDAGKADAIAYTWTETGGTKIGINMRWIQVGCSMKE
ncbi:MAG: CpcT/CpeT family chromophore lyase [Vicinamibacterales bacterium]|nr:CpcT/CpeT family chromophore lyase [Vicinamibacterales bacterium]